MNLEEERTKAHQMVSLFRKGYRGKDDSYFPIRIALQWQRVLGSSQLNIDDIREVVRLANEKKHLFDVTYFGLCNDMEKTFREIVKESFT